MRIRSRRAPGRIEKVVGSLACFDSVLAMPSLLQVLDEHTSLNVDERKFLRRICDEWHLIADLTFSDLVLWVPDDDPNMFWAAAQSRPMTGVTSMPEDVYGDLIAYTPENPVAEAFLSGEVVGPSANAVASGQPVISRAVPIRFEDRVIAVLERSTNQLALRGPSTLEDAYLEIGELLEEMLHAGEFPLAGDLVEAGVSPRVGDGLIRVGADGDVTYASPNALSCYRRLGHIGDLVDEDIYELTAELLIGQIDPEKLVFMVNEPIAREFDIHTGRIDLRVRRMPLFDRGQSDGMLVLVRDVSDLRARERQLVSKDATIREIHHRVKNNLQTVAALLRMQSRRMVGGEARAALEEATSRVGAIAAVHETLSQSYDEEVHFDVVADRLLRIVGAVSTAGGHVEIVREGSFGMVPAEAATSLALVVTELCQNAVEHGLNQGSGRVSIRAHQAEEELSVEVVDGGVGLSEDFDPKASGTLGLSIVTSLIAELEGTFDLRRNADGVGTKAVVVIPMRKKSR